MSKMKKIKTWINIFGNLNIWKPIDRSCFFAGRWENQKKKYWKKYSELWKNLETK